MASGKLAILKPGTLTRPDRYGDGAGRWLQVRDNQHRSGLFRYATVGKSAAADGSEAVTNDTSKLIVLSACTFSPRVASAANFAPLVQRSALGRG
jgi:hypothetical protein